jgi:hypothetical protein
MISTHIRFWGYLELESNPEDIQDNFSFPQPIQVNSVRPRSNSPASFPFPSSSLILHNHSAIRRHATYAIDYALLNYTICNEGMFLLRSEEYKDTCQLRARAGSIQ